MSIFFRMIMINLLLSTFFLNIAISSDSLPSSLSIDPELKGFQLKRSVTDLGGVSSFSFLSKIKGIAFSGIACPSPVLEHKSIRLKYVPENPDGYRLLVQIGKQLHFPYIPDWQLIPIASFANSPYDVCISLLGEKNNAQFFHIVYHTAFEDTLLGIRLLQASILLSFGIENSEFNQLNNSNFIGTGEIAPSALTSTMQTQYLAQTEQAKSRLLNLMMAYRYRSWCMVDDSVTILFSNQKDNLSFSGTPYYLFWYPDHITYCQRMKTAITKLDELEQQETIQSHKIAPDVAEIHHQLAIQLQKALSHPHDLDEMQIDYLYNQANSYFQNYQLIMNQFIKYKEKANNLLKEIYQTNLTIVRAEHLTQDMRHNQTLIQALNPLVFESMNRTMQYSAFFRYIKLKHPKEWNNFLQQISGIKTLPSVKTPNKLMK